MTLPAFYLPKPMGTFELSVDEVMYYLYLPIKRPGELRVHLPDRRLDAFVPLLGAVISDLDMRPWWMYLTVKRMYVGAGITANRPGWHCDGYLSDDLNYVWYDCVPTIFTSAEIRDLPRDHVESLKVLEAFDTELMSHAVIYPCGQLLRLDDRVVHKVDTRPRDQIMRTFVKITLSRNRFNLAGNSKNPMLPDDGPFHPREVIRNDPCKAQSSHA